MKTKPITISIVSEKGGVGKTTTAFNLAGALIKADKKVCLIDLDTQENLSQTFWIDEEDNAPTFSELIYNTCSKVKILNSADGIVRHTDYGLDYCPCSKELLNTLSVMLDKNMFAVKETLKNSIFDNYDFIIIDCKNYLNGALVPQAYTTYCENACDMAEVYECEKLINDFHNNNYGTVDESIFDDYNHIPLVTNKDKVSVYADFLGRSINSVYKDRIIKIEQFDTLYDMQAVLKDLDYYKMTNILTENLKDGGLLIVTPDGKKHETLSDYHYNDNIRIFVDMDGTLARFHDEVKYLERMWEEGFFKELKPFEEIVDSIHILKRDNPEAEIFILSAAIEGEPPYCQQQKHEWLDRYLPEIDRSHRIFTEISKPKADYIEGGICRKICYCKSLRTERRYAAFGEHQS